MKSMQTVLIFSLFFVSLMGCGRAYQSITADNLSQQLTGYEGQRILIVGVPDVSQRHDFLPPTPLHKGHWSLVINGVRCTETINFENEPRIRSMLQIAVVARKENHPIKVSGRVKGGQLKMEYFEGIRTDTAWYKNEDPYYSYGEYYEWHPFAFSPNGRVLRALEAR